MDVIASRFPEVPDVPSPARAAPPKAHDDPAAKGERAAAEHAITLRNRAWEPRSSLKFGLVTADVDAKFEIHQGTDRVIVTMYDRQTGEVLREIPSRHVLDQIAAVTSRGLNVDTTS